MDYSTRRGDSGTEVHVNYDCPCGCVAGLIYDRDSGSTHLGACCCGRLLWVGADAEAVVRRHFEPDLAYELDISTLTLPWGERAIAALAVPVGMVQQHSPEKEHNHDQRHD